MKNTGVHVRILLTMCELTELNAAETRGVVAAMLVIDGHCATRTEALRYVRALLK